MEDVKQLIDDLLQIDYVTEALAKLKMCNEKKTVSDQELCSDQELKALNDYVKTRVSVSPHKHAHKDYY